MLELVWLGVAIWDDDVDAVREAVGDCEAVGVREEVLVWVDDGLGGRIVVSTLWRGAGEVSRDRSVSDAPRLPTHRKVKHPYNPSQVNVRSSAVFAPGIE